MLNALEYLEYVIKWREAFVHKHTRKKMLILFLDFGDAELLSYQIKHNGKPLQDRERLIRQILEDIGHLDNMGIFGRL